MRVLAVTTSFPRDVDDHAGRFVYDLHAGLVEEGCRVTTLCPAASGLPEQEDGPAGRILRLSYARETRQDLFYGAGLELNWRRVRGPLRKFQRFSRAAIRALAELASDSDVLLGHWLWPGARLCVRATRSRPILGVAHGGDLHLLNRPFAGRFLGRPLRKRLHGVVATSSRGASLVQDRLHVPADRVVTRPMGVDPRTFEHPDPVPADWPQGYLLGVGRLVRIKGFDLLIQAAADLGLPLVLVGEGPEREALELEARALPVKVHFAGRLGSRDVAAAMGGCAAVVVPSRPLPSGRVEGCPVVAVEALMARAHVVAARTGGLADLLPAERLFPAENVPALAEALNRVLDLPRPTKAPSGLSRRDAARDLLSLV